MKKSSMFAESEIVTAIITLLFSFLMAMLILALPSAAQAHGGGVGENGCHTERSTGGYHCHRGQYAGMSFASAEEALDYFAAQISELEGVIIDIQPEPEPEPVVPEPVIQIPGALAWVPIDFGMVTKFSVLNDEWGAATDSKWLYVFRVSPPAYEVYAINRPARWYRNNYVLSETTPLSKDQLVDLVEAIIENET